MSRRVSFIIALVSVWFGWTIPSYGREAISPIAGCGKAEIAAAEQLAAELAFATAEFFTAIGYTDRVVAQVATGNKASALEDEKKALSGLDGFLGKLVAIEKSTNELRARAKSSAQRKQMEDAMGKSWDEYFDALISELKQAHISVTRFIARDKDIGMKDLERGDIKALIDNTGPLAADMVTSVVDMINHWVRSAVASHRAMDVTCTAIQ